MSAGRHRGPRTRKDLGRMARVGLSIVAAGVVAGSVAVAVEAVMTLGVGTGTAASATAVAVTVSPGAGGGDLKPGGSGQLRLVASNPHPVPVVIRALVLDTTRGAGGFATSDPGCPASAFDVSVRDSGDQRWRVPAHVDGVDGELRLQLPGAVTMSPTAPDPCQGVAVTVYLAART